MNADPSTIWVESDIVLNPKQWETGYMSSCRLCLDPVRQGSVEAWNEPLFESPNFVAVPSLGALVEGWLLLVPKKHFICMGALPDTVAIEMQQIKRFLCSVLQQLYGQAGIFEHGPSRPSGSVGCGVDHAHLHIVPVSFDLASAVTPFLPRDVLWSKANHEECQAAFGRGEDYLYLEQPVGAGRIATHQRFGSQLFRRAIATQIGAPDQFNWREYSQLPNLLATVDKLRTQGESVPLGNIQPEVAA